VRKIDIVPSKGDSELINLAKGVGGGNCNHSILEKEVSKVLQLSPDSKEDIQKKQINARVVGIVETEGQTFVRVYVYSYRRYSRISKKIY